MAAFRLPATPRPLLRRYSRDSPWIFQSLRHVSACIVGSGPAGFYTAQRLLRRAPASMELEVDMIEKLPAPYGLIRYGVAPDHPEVKNCSSKFEGLVTSDSRLAWFGGISLSDELGVLELQSHYDAVVLAVGAQRERHLGVPGESLRGIYTSQDWTRWINGYPSHQEPVLELLDPCVIVGNGNVALDVARLLLAPPAKLKATDICDRALSVLERQSTRHVQILGRRGPAQVCFTAKELRELLRLCEESGVSLYTNVEPQALHDALAKSLGGPRPLARVLELLSKHLIHYVDLPTWSGSIAQSRERSCMVSFFVSAKAFLPSDRDARRVAHACVVYNQLDAEERVLPQAPSQLLCEPLVLSAGSVVKCIGYDVSVPGMPARLQGPRGVLHQAGRVSPAEPERGLGGLYVSGWAKRGATGVLATTMSDAFETADTVVKDLQQHGASRPAPEQIRGRRWLRSWLAERGLPFVTFDDWLRMDAAEVRAGEQSHKPREKITSIQSMIGHGK